MILCHAILRYLDSVGYSSTRDMFSRSDESLSADPDHKQAGGHVPRHHQRVYRRAQRAANIAFILFHSKLQNYFPLPTSLIRLALFNASKHSFSILIASRKIND